MNYQDYDMMKCLNNGIKDVIWIAEDNELVSKLTNKGYYRKKVNDMWDFTSYFFFRYKKHKEVFMNEYYELIKNKEISLIHEEVGRLLGFPPKASKLFYDKMHNGTLHNNISMNFCGMYFASYRESIKEDVDWLIQTKPLIHGEVIMIENSYITIGDSDWLDLLYKVVDQYNS